MPAVELNEGTTEGARKIARLLKRGAGVGKRLAGIAPGDRIEETADGATGRGRKRTRGGQSVCVHREYSVIM